MKTTSILESIRNKINKIEKSNTEAESQAEPHDDFEYIDDNSKNIVNSKQTSGTRMTESATAEEVSAQTTDEDFDFLSDSNSDESNAAKSVVEAPIQKAPPAPVNKAPIAPITPNKDDDLDNIDIDDLEEQTQQSSALKEDDDLDNIDIDDLEEQTQQSSALKEDDDLDLDNIDIDDLEETIAPAAPISATTPKAPARTPIEEKLQAMQTTQAISSTTNDLDLEKELETEEERAPESKLNTAAPSYEQAAYEQPAPIQNNYQTQPQDMMNNSNNNSQIISDEIARKTQNAVRDIINSVPKPQNQQVLSTSAPAFKSGETIEDMVAAILAPKLEQWINENLPPMVEKIVKNEIKRLFPKDDH